MKQLVSGSTLFAKPFFFIYSVERIKISDFEVKGINS